MIPADVVVLVMLASVAVGGAAGALLVTALTAPPRSRRYPPARHRAR